MHLLAQQGLGPVAQTQRKEGYCVARIPAVPKGRCEFGGEVSKSLSTRHYRAYEGRYILHSLVDTLLEPEVRDTDVPVVGNGIEVRAQFKLAKVHVSSSGEAMRRNKR